MPTEQSISQLQALLKELCHLPQETEWVEFKHNADVIKIGEYISALANSAALLGKQTAYLVYGVDDKTHDVIGTTFKPSTQKYKGQELENWLLQKTAPKIHFQFYEFTHANDNEVVIVEIQASTHLRSQSNIHALLCLVIGRFQKWIKKTVFAPAISIVV